MTYARINGGMWVPTWPPLTIGMSAIPSLGTCTVDADEEEVQSIGTVRLPAGSGSKTFGTSGSAVQWIPGSSITFAANAVLRVGAKKASTIDAANGPPARATAGAAA